MFVVEAASATPPEGLGSLIKLLVMPQDEYIKTKTKGKSPKPKLDSQRVAGLAVKVLEERLRGYSTTLEVFPKLA